jgi:hypothetical protein
MPVSGLRLLADENIEASIVEILRAWGTMCFGWSRISQASSTIIYPL